MIRKFINWLRGEREPLHEYELWFGDGPRRLYALEHAASVMAKQAEFDAIKADYDRARRNKKKSSHLLRKLQVCGAELMALDAKK